jgi:hypothetical protein
MAWLTGYNYRKKITIDHTKVGGSVTYFPVVVVIDGDTDIGSRALSTGYDIRFTASDGTTLRNYERVSFAITDGLCDAIFWVKVPALSSTTDVELYLYYGKSDATDGQNKTGTWDDGGSNYFKGVWHLGETGTGAAGDYKDSTINANNSTNIANQPTPSAGIIGNGQTFNGVSQYIDLGNSASLAISTALTVSVFAKASNLAASKAIISRGSQGFNGTGWGFYRAVSPADVYFYIHGNLTSAISTTLSGGTFDSTYLTATWNGTTLRTYKNNVETGDVAANVGTVDGTNVNLFLGRSGAGNYFTGDIDEARLATTVRSAQWIATESNNQNSPSTFYSISAEEQNIVILPKPQVFQADVYGSLAKFLENYTFPS